ncbi:hypothetical protein ACNVED_12040 [Legionella sp. D16C41]|uniref:hypothetical protein n=1 Tax=Legionella sp. D16C41 TaxID=3402688 RepID=UPI003AF7C4B1
MSDYKHKVQHWDVENCFPNPYRSLLDIETKEVKAKRAALAAIATIIVDKKTSHLINRKEIKAFDEMEPEEREDELERRANKYIWEMPLAELAQLYQDLLKEKEVAQAELQKTEKKIASLESTLSTNEKIMQDINSQDKRLKQVITTNEQELEKIRQSKNQAPSTFDKFLADENPGFFKSLFKLIIPNSTIEESKRICRKYDEQEKKIQNLTHDINVQTRKRTQALHFKDTVLTPENGSISTDLKHYKNCKIILKTEIILLTESANRLKINLNTLLDATEDDKKSELEMALRTTNRTQEMTSNNYLKNTSNNDNNDDEPIFQMDIK